jgi:hypothetical protein
MDKLTAALTANANTKKFTADEVGDQVQAMLSHLQRDFLIHGLSKHAFCNDDTGMLEELERRDLVCHSRWSVLSSPICKQIVALYVNYGIGPGLSFNGKGKSKTAQERNQRLLEQILANPRNAKFFNTFGQRKTAKKGLTDGENFFAVFGSGANAIFRRIDSLTIYWEPTSGMINSGIATNPDDADETRYYVQTLKDNKGKSKHVIYVDWTNSAKEDGVLEDGTRISINGDSVIFTKDDKDVTPKTEITISNSKAYQWLFDGEGLRGIPLLNTSLVWCKAQSLFMRDRVAIMRGIATWLYDVKVKGGQKGVDVITSEYDSTLSNTNYNESNPKPVAGGARVHNGAVEWKPVPQETGADAARVDGDMLMNQAGIGAGVMAQYLGRGDLPNYAMANSMEGPMLKQWESYQEQLEDMFQTLFRIAGLEVEVNTPELIRKDTPAMLDGFGKIAQVVPGLTQSQELIRQILTLFNLDNEDTIVKEIEDAIRNMPEPQEPTQSQEEPD